jgi:hypothetical protein
MGRNTMTFFQKREIVSASMEVYKAIEKVNKALTGHNTKECDRVIKLQNLASNNVRYWIDRPVIELTHEENRKTAHYLDDLWKACQKELHLPMVEEANDGDSI